MVCRPKFVFLQITCISTKSGGTRPLPEKNLRPPHYTADHNADLSAAWSLKLTARSLAL